MCAGGRSASSAFAAPAGHLESPPSDSTRLKSHPTRNRHERVADVFVLAGVCCPVGARNRAGRRQPGVHRDSHRPVAAGEAGDGAAAGTRARGGGANHFAVCRVVGDDARRIEALHDRRMGSHGPRSDPHRRRPVPVGQGDLGDSQQSRRRVARSESRQLVDEASASPT